MDEATRLYKAFADPVRLRLLRLLAERGPNLCVCDIVDVTGLPQSTISRQMAQLRAVGLVTPRRAGTWMLYSLAEPKGDLHAALLKTLPCCGAEDAGAAGAEDVEQFDRLKKLEALACCSGELSAMIRKLSGRKARLPRA